MKFFLAVIAASAFAFVVAQEPANNLRGGEVSKSIIAAKPMFSSDTINMKKFETHIQIGGLLHKPTTAELAVLYEIVTKTYNLSFQAIGETIVKTVDVKLVSEAAVMIGDDIATVGVNFWFNWNSGYCRLCDYSMDDWYSYMNSRDDLTAMEADFIDTHIVQIHQHFEKRMCHKLVKSGVPNFAHARNCFFTIVQKTDYENEEDKAMELELEHDHVTLLPVPEAPE